MGAIYKQDSGKQVLNEGGAIGKSIVNLPYAEVVRLTLEHHGAIDAHLLDIPVTFHVVSGIGVAIIDGDEIAVEAGDVLVIEPGEDRGWYNERSEPLEILAIKHRV